MKRYKLEKHWNLLFTKVAVKGEMGIITLRLLVDTGSSYTILPIEILEAIGYSPAPSKDKVRIVTANGVIIAPRVKVCWINLFGKKLAEFPIIAYTIPTSIYADGLVGMDVLKKTKAIIDIDKGYLEREAE